MLRSGHRAGREVPKRMVVVGAGAIGLELGSVWSRLGAQVTVVELLLRRFWRAATRKWPRPPERVLKKQGLTFYTAAKVTGTKGNRRPASRHVSSGKAKPAWRNRQMWYYGPWAQGVQRRPGCCGNRRRAWTKNRGRVNVDKHYQTNVPNIYAIGDVILGPMLAHKAEEEGIAIMELIAGQAGHVNYDVIPSIVYTNPGTGIRRPDRRATAKPRASQ